MIPVFMRAAYAGLGSAIAILVLCFCSAFLKHPMLMAPFGASCAILFAIPEVPLAQPRNVIGGHFVAALTGLVAVHFFPVNPVTIALAVGVGVSLMVITRTVHPPAGANPLVILLSHTVLPWSFLLFPVVLGALVLVILATLYHPFTTRAYHHPFVPKILRARRTVS